MSNPILVRRARPADAAALARTMAEPAVFANLLQLPMATEEMWRNRLEAGVPAAGSDPVDLFLVAEIDGTFAGSAGLHPAARHRRRHVALLGISVATAFHGRGVGRALMQAACDYADGWGHYLRIELTVFTDNAAAIALYQRFGFRIEGTHRAYALREGRYDDVHAMARLHPNPPVAAWPQAGARAEVGE